jgi:excinuclease ABC subunit A
MTVREALQFFRSSALSVRVANRLQVLDDVGLGYIRLGQAATSLSGGEAQRVKLAAHLSAPESGHTLFVFDEPTTGLHFDDIAKLISCFNALIDSGNSVVIIEHNLDVIKCADHVIDMGPEAGTEGGCNSGVLHGAISKAVFTTRNAAEAIVKVTVVTATRKPIAYIVPVETIERH